MYSNGILNNVGLSWSNKLNSLWIMVLVMGIPPENLGAPAQLYSWSNHRAVEYNNSKWVWNKIHFHGMSGNKKQFRDCYSVELV